MNTAKHAKAIKHCNPSIIRPASLEMHASGLFFEDKTIEPDSFAVRLWPGALLRFERLANSGPGCFAAAEVLYANANYQHPSVLARGVLWSRRAMPSLSLHQESTP